MKPSNILGVVLIIFVSLSLLVDSSMRKIPSALKSNISALRANYLISRSNHDAMFHSDKRVDYWQCAEGAGDTSSLDKLVDDLKQNGSEITGCWMIPIARSYCRAGNIELASQHLELAESACSNKDLLSIIFGDIEYSRGNADLAYLHWISTSNGLWVVLDRSNSLSKQGRKNESLELLRWVVRDRSNVPEHTPIGTTGSTYEQIGEIAYEQGDWKLVVLAYREALKYQKIKSFGYAYYGRALREVGELGESRQVLESAIPYYTEKNPVAQAVLLEQLGNTMLALGDSAEAIRVYHQALFLFEENSAEINPDRIAALRQTIDIINSK